MPRAPSLDMRPPVGPGRSRDALSISLLPDGMPSTEDAGHVRRHVGDRRPAGCLPSSHGGRVPARPCRAARPRRSRAPPPAPREPVQNSGRKRAAVPPKISAAASSRRARLRGRHAGADRPSGLCARLLRSPFHPFNRGGGRNARMALQRPPGSLPRGGGRGPAAPARRDWQQRRWLRPRSPSR